MNSIEVGDHMVCTHNLDKEKNRNSISMHRGVCIYEAAVHFTKMKTKQKNDLIVSHSMCNRSSLARSTHSGN